MVGDEELHSLGLSPILGDCRRASLINPQGRCAKQGADPKMSSSLPLAFVPMLAFNQPHEACVKC